MLCIPSNQSANHAILTFQPTPSIPLLQSLFVHTGSVVIVVRIVPAMQFVLHGDITLPLYKWRLNKCLHFIKFKSKKLSTSTYGYYCGCSKARSSCKRNKARRKRTAPTPENLNRLFLETPVPGEPCRRGKPHPCDGPENKGPRE